MVADAHLGAALARSLVPPVRICRREPWPYASSVPLERLEVETGAGERLELIWKDLSPDVLLPGARLARGSSELDPTRELRAYDLLDVARLSTPRRYAALEERDRAGLLLEAVDGRRLDEVGELAGWCAVARWLAHAHVTLTLWAQGLGFLSSWTPPSLDGAIASAGGERGRRLGALVPQLEATIAHADALPSSVIHGELYPANVIVAGDRVCVLDWETIARGPALLDLAALTAGHWDDPAEPLAETYRTALPAPPPRAELLADLDACRLLVAAGWLAAPPQWVPPPAQARDWLADAELIAGRMAA